MKVGVSLPEELLEFADAEAARRGVPPSGLLAELLDEVRIRERIRRSIDEHGWDVAESDSVWRAPQLARRARENAVDEW